MLLRPAEGPSEPFRGRKEEALSLTQSPDPGRLALPSLSLPPRAHSVYRRTSVILGTQEALPPPPPRPQVSDGDGHDHQ